jgi:hypothetical protein
LAFFVERDDAEMFLNEMEDLYDRQCGKTGFWRATVWYCFQIVAGVGPLFRHWMEQRKLRDVLDSPFMLVLTTASLLAVTTMAAVPLTRMFTAEKPTPEKQVTEKPVVDHGGYPKICVNVLRGQ